MQTLPSIPSRLSLLRLAFALTFNTVAALATDLTWTGAISSDWNNPTNWSPPQGPGSGDHVIISSGSVTTPASATFAVMDWTGGTIYSLQVRAIGGATGYSDWSETVSHMSL